MSQQTDRNMPVAIDLFAGGGALTVGLKRAGFTVLAAVEIEKHAFATYTANHPEVRAYKQDIRTIKGGDLKALAPGRVIDLLAGCPPCQGFTSLTSKYRRYDLRNDLVREMARLVEEIRPKAVMMENVPGLAGRGKPLLNEFRERIERLGYTVTMEVLQVADYGVPQNRRRLVVLGGLGCQIPIPLPTHSKDGKKGFAPWRTVKDTIGSLAEPILLAEAREHSAFERSNWHLVRSLSEMNKLRLKHAKPGATWIKIPEDLRPECHKGTYRGFRNVYGRMAWDEVAPTITGGCTTLSKGRFGHPEMERTISVREAALLQTFPSDYKLDTPYMEYACNIVGNALPCDFAEAVAKESFKTLRSSTTMGRWPGNAQQERTTFGGLNRGDLMSRVLSTGNQTTEMQLAYLLRKEGLTGWRRHQPLPGRPDFVWPKMKVAVFVDGCFWHGHDCRNLTPKTNFKAWRDKIEKTKARDRRANRSLRQQGWKVIRIWECRLTKAPGQCLLRIRHKLEENS
ncbi:MAG: DNA mismatch endonuclease Vsr [Nitrospira sp.]|nr:DNA mismatch endonuclease Vsr [Nitrospira sp.]